MKIFINFKKSTDGDKIYEMAMMFSFIKYFLCINTWNIQRLQFNSKLSSTTLLIYELIKKINIQIYFDCFVYFPN